MRAPDFLSGNLLSNTPEKKQSNIRVQNKQREQYISCAVLPGPEKLEQKTYFTARRDSLNNESSA
jgi:hypothetical protein